MSVLFISDLHLEAERPDITRAFLSFLDERARRAEALYILGDFFEAWIGDDGMDAFQPRMKAVDIIDVTPEEVPRVMRRHGVRTLIHGHTHRPAEHPLDIDGQPARRIVLGDWDHQGWALEVDANGHRQAPFPL